MNKYEKNPNQVEIGGKLVDRRKICFKLGNATLDNGEKVKVAHDKAVYRDRGDGAHIRLDRVKPGKKQKRADKKARVAEMKKGKALIFMGEDNTPQVARA